MGWGGVGGIIAFVACADMVDATQFDFHSHMIVAMKLDLHTWSMLRNGTCTQSGWHGNGGWG